MTTNIGDIVVLSNGLNLKLVLEDRENCFKTIDVVLGKNVTTGINIKELDQFSVGLLTWGYGSEKHKIIEIIKKDMEEEIKNMEIFNIEKHWDDFMRYKLAVNCPTEKLANEFLEYCTERDIKWNGGKSLGHHNNWKHKETCYFCYDNEMTFGHVNFDSSKSGGIPAVEFYGFDTYNHIKQPKPPLVIMPKQIFEWHRAVDLCRALQEHSLYEDVDLELMIKWSEELNDRLYGLKGDKQINNSSNNNDKNEDDWNWE